MKLTVRVTESLLSPTGSYLVLCDENGDLLPGQKKVTFSQGAGDGGHLTVEFSVDGDTVKLVGEPAKC